LAGLPARREAEPAEQAIDRGIMAGGAGAGAVGSGRAGMPLVAASMKLRRAAA
jgi:hypothetical protein